jgi:CPA1 family monovalent cation:H+ antiporter
MHNEAVVLTVIGIVGLLLVASAASIGLRRINLPYTVGLVLLGLVLGVVSDRYEALEPLHQIALSPELILFVFLPTLIFESAFNLDSRLLSQNLVPVFILAAPGLLLSTALVGGMMTWLTPLEFGQAVLFGALISATDPVAVIALFKEVGAPKRLAILVEGESLFNDATAIVLFGIILSVVAGGTSFSAGTVGSGVSEFLVVFLGGLLVGGAIGYLMIRSIALSHGDPLVEVALSTVVAYAAFIAADHYLHVSGVMATVGAGIVVGTLGATRFTQEVRAYLHQFWEYAAFVANSLIFLLVGISVSLSGLVEYAGPIGWAILVAMVARAIAVFGLIPVVTRLPGAEPITGPYRAVMYWGGLRGAVALALVLSLPDDFPGREMLVALAVGVVLFTLLSGGLTMAPLISWLGLDKPGLVEQVAGAQATLAAKRAALGRVQQLANTGHFSNRLLGEIEAEYREGLESAEQELARLNGVCSDDEIRLVLWSEALTTERTVYHEEFANGAISEPVLRELELSTELRRDQLKRGEEPSGIDSVSPVEVRITDGFFGLLGKVSPRSGAVMRHRMRALAAHYERDLAVLEASRRVIQQLEHLSDLSGIPHALSENCRVVYRHCGDEAMERIDEVAEHFPEYVQAVQQRTARRMAIDGESAAIDALAATGGIPKSVASEAHETLQNARRLLARRPVSALEPKPEEILARVPFFAALGPDDLHRVAEALVPRPALPGEPIITQGERGSSLFLIARGVVAVLIAPPGGVAARVASLHAGDFFGEGALLSAEPRNATVRAVTGCQLFELSKKDVDQICTSCPGVKHALVTAHEERRRASSSGHRPRLSGHYQV